MPHKRELKWKIKYVRNCRISLGFALQCIQCCLWARSVIELLSLRRCIQEKNENFTVTVYFTLAIFMHSGVDPYGTGGTCPPNIYFGGTCLSMSPQCLGVSVLETSIFSRHLIARSPSFAATSIDSLQLQRIFFLRNCRLNCNGSIYM